MCGCSSRFFENYCSWLYIPMGALLEPGVFPEVCSQSQTRNLALPLKISSLCIWSRITCLRHLNYLIWIYIWGHRMNHTSHTCIRICVGFNQTWMVNQLNIGLDWHIWLDWLWSIFWAKFVMKTNEKKEKKRKKGACIFSFSNVWMPPRTRILCSMYEGNLVFPFEIWCFVYLNLFQCA